VAICLTGKSDEPYEIIKVILKIRGIDFIDRFLEGFQSAAPMVGAAHEIYQRVPDAIEKSGVDIAFALEHNNSLMYNNSDLTGERLAKNQTLRFFMSINCPFINCILSFPDISIVAVTTEGEKLLFFGQEISDLYAYVFRDWGRGPWVQDFNWRISVHTFFPHLPDTTMIGTTNDRTIDLSLVSNQ
jgi:hypothetical protein